MVPPCCHIRRPAGRAGDKGSIFRAPQFGSVRRSFGHPLLSLPRSEVMHMPVRIVSLAAHSGAGKTTLSEALLHRSGAISRAGRVEDGTTQSDHSEEERQHGFSIRTGVLRLQHRDVSITLLDTPGFADFVREIRGGIRAADNVLVVVSATGGVEVGTERVWTTADRFGMPRIVVLSKMDRERAHFAATLADIRATLGADGGRLPARRRGPRFPWVGGRAGRRGSAAGRAAQRCGRGPLTADGRHRGNRRRTDEPLPGRRGHRDRRTACRVLPRRARRTAVPGPAGQRHHRRGPGRTAGPDGPQPAQRG
ncbi:GTP-binding protein [Deinococcus malanensis]|uniref:GTP-binding protein n=1 Tax=Deinococcus malanensis TaxID=1706855 RepID=UPI00362AE376